jgi:hypothetical protein
MTAQNVFSQCRGGSIQAEIAQYIELIRRQKGHLLEAPFSHKLYKKAMGAWEGMGSQQIICVCRFGKCSRLLLGGRRRIDVFWNYSRQNAKPSA